jgi:hypothetical protein
MNFNSLAFLVFAVVVVSLFWALRSDRWRLPLLFEANFVFLRVVGLAIYGAFAGSGGAGLWLGNWNCANCGAGWEDSESDAVGMCGATGGVGVFQVCEFLFGEFEERSFSGGVGTGVDDAEHYLAGGGEFLHFPGDQLSGFCLQWIGACGAEFFADGGLFGIFSAFGGGADYSGAFVFAAVEKRAGF